MTIEEAIEFFKGFIETLKLNGEDKVLNNDYCKASTKAVEALEKQIAKKPGVQFHQDGGAETICIVCGYTLSEDEEKYCSNCGQKIDWGKE